MRFDQLLPTERTLEDDLIIDTDTANQRLGMVLDDFLETLDTHPETVATLRRGESIADAVMYRIDMAEGPNSRVVWRRRDEITGNVVECESDEVEGYNIHDYSGPGEDHADLDGIWWEWCG